MALLVELLARQLGYDVCSIYLANDEPQLILRATHGLHSEARQSTR